jgi:hypothetical protein
MEAAALINNEVFGTFVQPRRIQCRAERTKASDPAFALPCAKDGSLAREVMCAKS